MPDVAGFLREREDLIASAMPGTMATRELSDATDRAVSALAEAALSRLPATWTVLALGGWGARRLLPHSDLDLLVVTDASAAELKPVLAEVLYPLWDAGLTVGHQVRSAREHVRMVRTDLDTLTATLTGRVLCGNAALGEELLARVASDAKRHARRLVPALTARPRPGSPYLLEPDLKQGAGGQRDLDELVWLGAVLAGRTACDAKPLLEHGTIGADEARRLTAAGYAITAARWALQRQVTRPTSLLTLELAADSELDLDALHEALGDAFHILSRVRGRLAGDTTAWDPSPTGEAPGPLDADQLLTLLETGEQALPALEEAAWAGLLDDLVPAFNELMCTRRPGLSHLYTVGDHSLRTACLVTTVAQTHPEARRAAASLGDHRALQVAALLHDTGKAQRGPGHAERGEAFVRTLGGRFHLSPALVEEAALLVREHLLLVETATGRDIHDEDVLLRTAARIGDARLIDELYLLTLADSVSTGPGAWTAWHAALIGELADRLRSALSDEVVGAGVLEHAEAVRAAAFDTIARMPGTDALQPFARRASLRYLAANRAEDVVIHARLVNAVVASGRPDALEVAVSPGPTDGTWRVSVAAFERPGLFALLCGAAALSGLDILAADAYGSTGRAVLDVFIVRSDTRAGVDTATWAAFERHVRGAFVDPTGLAARLAQRRRDYPSSAHAQPSVRIGETGAYATAVEVRAPDRVGLLYEIALALTETDLHIRWARAVTQEGVVRDVFHVTDLQGEPVDDPGVLGHLAMRIRERIQ